MKAGTKVGAGRWPNIHEHPDNWGRPWSGTILAVDSPRAWAKTPAFPTTYPDPILIAAHVKLSRDKGLPPLPDVPVLWDFGRHGQIVYWEPEGRLRPYPEDLQAWAASRREAYLRLESADLAARNRRASHEA